MKVISTALILISLIASLYYSYLGLTKPGTDIVYSKANIPLWGQQSLAFILGAGGVLLLFPKTYILAGVLMTLHSLFTIGCFVAIKDVKGGLIEFLFLQIPVFILWAGYPITVLEKFRNLFT